jgi:hypothetical protein
MMNQADAVKKQIVELIDLFELKKHVLQEHPAAGQKDLVFGDVVLLNKTEDDPTTSSWIARRVVRTDMPQVFEWLFKGLARIIAPLPGYGPHKEEIFGRLGNSLARSEELDPPLVLEEKVAAVIQDFWEICQDLLEGRLESFSVALGASVMDDFVTRSVKSGFVDQETFERMLFGEEI